MKNFIFILLLLITGLTTTISTAQGSWSLQTNPTTDTGESMQFVSATEGWINLTSNGLLHTTNGGINWQVVIPNATDVCAGMDAPGSRISFINATTGWVIKTLGDNNNPQGAVLYKTSNGGSTWEKTLLSSTIGEAGIQVQFIDATNGWVLIYNMNTGTPSFLKTTNGGITWLPTNGGGIFYYVNAMIGYSFSASPSMIPPYTIYKTTDGGANWTPQYVDNTAGEINDIRFTDANNGWAVGNNGKLFKTTDGGTNWIKSIKNSDYKNYKVFFVDNNTGWIAEKRQGFNPSLLYTANGGISWTEQNLPFNYEVYSMFFWDANTGWAAADFGGIAKYSVYTGSYSNANLIGPWLFYKDVSPIDPYNDNLNYFVFDGNGNITDFSGFGGPWTGSTYSVSASGAISGNITNGVESFPFGGQLTSTTEGTGTANGQNWKFHKITNPGALKDKIAGTLSTANCGSRNVTLNVDSNGIITSAIGLSAPVTGRVYADLGVYIGHMTTGEMGAWHELSFWGNYSNNDLIGQLGLDANDCTNRVSNLVRSNNQPINSDWTPQISGTTNSLKSAFFTDANNGYAVGGGQAGQSLLKTTDGGNTWISLTNFTNSIYTLRSVFSTSATTTYCAGGDGSPNQTILKTTNSGSNWTNLNGIGATQINSLYFINSNIGYAVGGGNNTGQNIILKTLNGGASWTAQSSPVNNLTFYSVFFTDENTGYIVGESGMDGTILKTTNGGTTWIQQSSGTGNHLYSVFFVDSNTGFIVGGNGVILKTTNDGTNWISKSSGTNAKLYSVNFLDASLGFAVGESGTILKTTNGGEDWTLQPSGTMLNLNSVYLKNNVGYAVGESGIILKNTNVSLAVKENIVDKFITIYPNPNKGTFTIDLKEVNPKMQIEIFNVWGQKINKELNLKQTFNEIDLSSYAKGVYFIKITDGENSYTEKMVIQ